MKNIYLLILIIVAGCSKNYNDEQEIMTAGVKKIFESDQNDRKSELRWSRLSKRDELRKKRANQLIDSGLVESAKEHQMVAYVFQHGNDSNDYAKAVSLMKKAIELDSTINKRLYAAATDRYLLSTGKPQIYGTQYSKTKFKPWIMKNYDTTKVSDKERIEFGVGTLAEQRAKLKKLNNN
ncbi:hypothetical protein [Aquimarina brevivitae]|uniref:Tetratricopeptide repeat protein n=1 Tax=Aquimarina brevivitae TaxID=323412 RepID=A0A4Q7P2H2_9FLAO|nr:hypothetical protein [Aquimarina brevivitae]RZS93580.1 hypothetical protein EV197_2160 [Aquimarina brevivitae]